MPVAVVRGALIIVHEHFVSFAEFLKFFFRVRISRVLVGMKLYREFAIRLLYIISAGVAGNA
jgi:hypothetical protein